MSLFSAVETFFVGFRLLWLLSAVRSLFRYHCQVRSLAGCSLCHISCFGGGDNLLDLFKIFVPRVQEGCSSHLKVVMQRVEGDNKCYTVPDCPMLRDCGLETLYELFYLRKDGSSLLFISEQLHNSGIVQEFFEDRVYNALAYLRADLL